MSGLFETASFLLFSSKGVIKLGDKREESKCTLVYGQMNEPPGARARVALTGSSKMSSHAIPDFKKVRTSDCPIYFIAAHSSVH